MELEQTSSTFKMDKKLFENIQKSPFSHKADYGEYQHIAQVIIDKY